MTSYTGRFQGPKPVSKHWTYGGTMAGKIPGRKDGLSDIHFLIRHCGVKAAYFLLFFVALYFIAAAPSSTADIWRYARKILGYGRLKSAAFIFRNYFSFGQSIIDKVAISSGLSDRYNYKFEDFDLLKDAVEAGRGAIIIGAHFGNWAAGEPFSNGTAPS